MHVAPGQQGTNRLSGSDATALRIVAAITMLSVGSARASDFFGPSQASQLQPELQVFQEVIPDRDFRLIYKLLPTFVPSQSYAEMGAGVYAAWLMEPLLTGTITPNLTRRRRLDVRLGAEWYPSLENGSAGASNVFQIEAEATPRLVVPANILATFRGRVDARWQFAAPTSFDCRLRVRPQLEREFALSSTTSLTPFGNAEVIWSTRQDMWDQFRLQVGLQLGVYWFGKGQVIELNGSVVTYLQPNRSHAPVLGVVWQQFL